MNCNSNVVGLKDIGITTLDTCSQSCTTLPINLVCNNLIIPSSEFILANQYNNHSNKKNFYLPLKDINGIDWTGKQFYIITEQNGIYNKIEILGDNLKITDTSIQLIWDIDKTVTADSGEIKIQIEVFGENYDYYSNVATFKILESIKADNNIETNYPIILSQLQQKIKELENRINILENK